MIRWVLGSVLLVALVVHGAPAVASQGTTPPSLATELQGVVARHLANAKTVPGLAVYVSAPGAGIEWRGAAGLADLATGAVLGPDDTFRIASNTKTYTAAATLRLVEDGAVGLDQPIGELLPAEYLDVLTSGGYDPKLILVNQVLTHTSGLYDYGADPAFQAAVFEDPTKSWTRLEQVQFAIDHGQPLGGPGETFGYSDTGFILLGEIIEQASGQPLAAAYRELLDFARLGLESTYLEDEEPIPAGVAARAHQYFGEIDATNIDPSFDLYGGGGLVATVADLGRFYQALLHGEVFRYPATLETMLTIPASTLGSGAMGIFAHEYGGHQCWEHDGFWGTAALHCPEIDVTVAFSMTQAWYLTDLDSAALITDLLATVVANGDDPGTATATLGQARMFIAVGGRQSLLFSHSLGRYVHTR